MLKLKKNNSGAERLIWWLLTNQLNCMNRGAHHYAVPSSVCHFISGTNILLKALISNTIFVLSIRQKTEFHTHTTACLVHWLKRTVSELPFPTICFFGVYRPYLYLYVKRPARYLNPLPPTIAEFKNMWIFTFSPRVFMAPTGTNLLFHKICKIVCKQNQKGKSEILMHI